MKHLNTILKIKKEFRFAVSFISFLLFFISGSYSQVPQLQWEKHDWNRIINNICTTNDGYVIVGKNLTGGGYSFVMKLNQSCDSVWEKGFFHDSQMNGRKANCVIQTSDGNYVFTGKAYYDIFVVKLNQNGDTLWQKFYGTTNTDEAYCIEETSDGGLVLTGVWEYGESTYEGDAFVMKLDANGNQQWLYVFNEYNNYGIGICLVGDFSKTLPSKRQLRSLRKLLIFLMRRYRIPPSNVIGHRDAPGASTACPGNAFYRYLNTVLRPELSRETLLATNR